MPNDDLRWVDIGDGHSLAPITGDPEHWRTADERLLRWEGDRTLIGFAHRHPSGAGRGTCTNGFYLVQYKGTGLLWELRSLDPLHVEPSIRCGGGGEGGCGDHGYVRGGRWVPA